MRHFLTALGLLMASLPCLGKPPSHEVIPQINALAASYHTETNEIRTILYATNHEDFPILCDAQMENDKKEKTRGKEIIVNPGKTVEFPFKHRPYIEHIRIFLICQAANDKDAKSSNDDTIKSYQAGKLAEPAKPVHVIEENLGNF